MILHLGVIDIPYQPTEGRASAKDLPTTGEVADILETEYGVMGSFVRAHEQDIADRLTNSLAGSLETLLMGGPVNGQPFATAMGGIQEDFRRYLESGEVEGQGLPGVPTQAAKDGVNHRLKHPYAKGNPRRPSFIDTGTYQLAFRAWVD